MENGLSAVVQRLRTAVVEGTCLEAGNPSGLWRSTTEVSRFCRAFLSFICNTLTVSMGVFLVDQQAPKQLSDIAHEGYEIYFNVSILLLMLHVRK